jgi:hypothetical protein
MKTSFVWIVELEGSPKFSSSSSTKRVRYRVVADDFRLATSMAQELAQRDSYKLNSEYNFEVAKVDKDDEVFIEGEA